GLVEQGLFQLPAAPHLGGVLHLQLGRRQHLHLAHRAAGQQRRFLPRRAPGRRLLGHGRFRRRLAAPEDRRALRHGSRNRLALARQHLGLRIRPVEVGLLVRIAQLADRPGLLRPDLLRLRLAGRFRSGPFDLLDLLGLLDLLALLGLLGLPGLAVTARLAAPHLAGRFLDQIEVDLALVQVDARHAHLHGIAEAEAAPRAFAGQAMVQRVEVVVVGGQAGDVHQALDVDVGQLDEDAEAGDRGDHAGEGLAHAILHVFALEPVDHVAGGPVGAPLGHRAVLAELLTALPGVWVDARLGYWRSVDTDNMLGLAPRADHAADRPVCQQVRVAADRRGEVGVGLVVETEVADVLRAVHRLAQGAQHHGLDQLEVRTLAHGFQQAQEVLGRRI